MANYSSNKVPFTDEEEEAEEELSQGKASSGEEEAAFIQDDQQQLRRSKRLVYVALLVSAAAIGAVTYIFLNREEKKVTGIEFDAQASDILSDVQKKGQDIVQEIQMLSESITSLSKSNGCIWPFCTFGDFDVLATSENILSEFIAFAPLVKDSQKSEWEAYTTANQDWISETSREKGNLEAAQISPLIHSFKDLVSREGNHSHRELEMSSSHYLPLWQTSPILPTSLFNIDLLSHSVLAKYFEQAQADQVILQTETFLLTTLIGRAASSDSDSHPRSALIYPVFDDFEADGNVVGFVFAVLEWDVFFEGIVDSLENQVYIAVEETCGEGFSYRIPKDENGFFVGKGTEYTSYPYYDSRKSKDFLIVADAHDSHGHDDLPSGHSISGEASDEDSQHVHHQRLVRKLQGHAGHMVSMNATGEAEHESDHSMEGSNSTGMMHEVTTGEQTHPMSNHSAQGHVMDEERPSNATSDALFPKEHDDMDNITDPQESSHMEHNPDDMINQGMGGSAEADDQHEQHQYVDNSNSQKAMDPTQPHENHEGHAEVAGGNGGMGSVAHEGHAEGQRTASSCHYVIHVFPTELYHESHSSNKPLFYTVFVVATFVLTGLIFPFYDCMMKSRQDRLLATARRTHAVIENLFPKNVHQRIMEEAEEKTRIEAKTSRFKSSVARGLLADADEAQGHTERSKSKHLADLFPSATLFFGDIAGFTAWSSAREPSQVFELLETLYGEFDAIAKRRRIFKVETIGDCYVAASGLPEKRREHAVAMARFASECLEAFSIQVQLLESTLGPETSELGFRIGLHSGPVTAGVLRGDKARFQLFGDTVNTCARVESSGLPNRIHVSEATADLLKAAGKVQWLTRREDTVVAKGKGQLKTFWLRVTSNSGHSDTCQSETGSSIEDEKKKQEEIRTELPSEQYKTERLIDWITDLLGTSLCQVLEKRRMKGSIKPEDENIAKLEKAFKGSNGCVLDEAKDILELPQFEKHYSREPLKHTSELEKPVLQELRDFVSAISGTYRNSNHFHNFEHVSHVVMSVTKLLSRIVVSDLDSRGDVDEQGLHDYTYGIASDPLTQFACIFSALVHDVDHQGVPNAQLVQEKQPIASRYNNKSVAEQNSVDIAWGILMAPRFQRLRRAIYTTGDELVHFRQLVVNTVMATDIMDKELSMARKDRWQKAFAFGSEEGEIETVDDRNRKATIIIEHLIQASDVSHTMQHWQIYRKWNSCLFKEMYKAYKEGRSKVDPSVNWYKGELGFFDFYIIPLAKELQDCGVFGVSSDEYLQYALTNRKEWEAKGQEIVNTMVEEMVDWVGETSACQKYGYSAELKTETVEI